jgi:hypothetical protein
MCAGWSSPARAALTNAAQLAAAYDRILDARFDQADAQLARACPPAPAEACQDLRLVALWWQILLNPETRALDDRFERAAGAAIAASEAWTRREPRRAEAWFYLAGAYAPRVQWRVLRGERLAAAYDGKHIKDALERALALDPTMADAYFGLGLYHYYAGVAPAAAKILRFLLLLPGGDRAEGLRQILQARTHGEVIGGEADYQLQQIYFWYEHQPEMGRRLLEGLVARYPFNPLFRQALAAALAVYFDDQPAAVTAWRDLLDRAVAKQVYAPEITEVRARLGLADALVATNDVDQAIDQLQRVVAVRPSAPAGALARAERQLRDLKARPPRN